MHFYRRDVAHHVELDQVHIHVTLYTDGSWDLENDIDTWSIEGEGFCPSIRHDIHEDCMLRDFLALLAYGDDEETCPTHIRQQLRYWEENVGTWTDHLATHGNIELAG